MLRYIYRKNQTTNRHIIRRKTNKSKLLGVEYKQEDPDVDTFDPNKITINTKLLTLQIWWGNLNNKPSGLILFFNAGKYVIIRKYQLTESLILKNPIPLFYVVADSSERWTMVDGIRPDTNQTCPDTIWINIDSLPKRLHRFPIYAEAYACKIKTDWQKKHAIINKGGCDDVSGFVFERAIIKWLGHACHSSCSCCAKPSHALRQRTSLCKEVQKMHLKQKKCVTLRPYWQQY